MLASPEFREAAHHALFAERAVPLLHEAEAVIAAAEAAAKNPTSQLDMEVRQELGRRYQQARTLVPELREYLYPED